MIVTIVGFFLVHYLIKCIGSTRTCCWKKHTDCLARWLVNATGYLIGRCADWSRKFISNPDWQLWYVFTGLLLKLGFAFGVRFASARGLLWVCIASGRGLLWVRSSRPQPDTESEPEVRFGSAFCYSSTHWGQPLHQVWYWSSEGVKRYWADKRVVWPWPFNMWPWKSIAIIYSLRATPVPSLVLINWRGQKILSRQHIVYRLTDPPTYRPTDSCKTICPLFQGRHKNYPREAKLN